MGPLRKALFGTGALLALWIGWGAYVDRTTERVPYETVGRFDGVEVRHYPQTVLVETTAPDSSAAFRRLFRYISGANEGDQELAMTAPVTTRGETVTMTAPVRIARRSGESVSMTAPVRSRRDADGVTMAFHLPSECTPSTAPTPTNPDVDLVVEPPRTVAVRRFSWYPTDRRVVTERERLLRELARRGVEVTGESAVLQYDDPWTPPFMRRNEVEIPVDEDTVPS